MGWQVHADSFDTADFSGAPTKWQVFTLDNDTALKAIRSWFVFYNDPIFTDIRFRIYSYKGDSPRQLLYTTDEYLTKAEILTLDNGHKEIYGAFTNAPYLKGGDSYALVPWISGYTGDESSHVAWTKEWYNLKYAHHVSVTVFSDILVAPFDISLIGARL